MLGVSGGRAKGHGRTSDGELDVDVRMPKELGGEGGAPNPEQLFAVHPSAGNSGASLVFCARTYQLNLTKEPKMAVAVRVDVPGGTVQQ
jgi:organic hydroperoxide reductase OsmC/OhrA